MHETSLYEANSFVTLTIAPYTGDTDDSRPHDVWTKSKSARELPTIAQDGLTQARPKVAHVDNSRADKRRPRPEEGLNKKDHQKFMKRLRWHIHETIQADASIPKEEKKDREKVRFFMCGEYGEKNDRPHYHYILMNWDFADKYYWRTEGDNKYYRSPTLEKLWPYGHCEIGAVTFETCAYVARYVTKKITGEKAWEHYRRTGPNGDYWLEPEFGYMSRRPGIGKGWIEKYLDDVYNYDTVNIRGASSRPPRYYDNYLGSIDETRLRRAKEAREAKQKAQPKKSQQKRRTEETITRAGLALKRRPL